MNSGRLVQSGLPRTRYREVQAWCETTVHQLQLGHAHEITQIAREFFRRSRSAVSPPRTQPQTQARQEDPPRIGLKRQTQPRRSDYRTSNISNFLFQVTRGDLPSKAMAH